MANDKDFVVNGPVVVGKDTKVTVGSITSSDIDLSTGNYFDDTLAANTTYTISNAGDVQAFQLEVTGGDVVYDLAGTSYDSVNSGVLSEVSNITGLYFKPDGTKMYTQGTNQSRVYQYSLSTAWDVSTASYDSVSYPYTSPSLDPLGLFFKSDGTKMYLADNLTDTIYQYTLSTAWDVSTASYDSKSADLSGQIGSLRDFTITSDGTTLFASDFDSEVYQYTLSTAHDVSTASYASKTLDVSSEITSSLRSLFVSPDGVTLIVGDLTTLFSYTMSTAKDLSTASYESVSFNASSQETEVRAIAFKSDGSKMYLSGGSETIYQYSTSTESTLTWPTSIEWAAGIAPSAPANGETDVFTFVTDDGGTTYTGVKSIDNAS